MNNQTPKEFALEQIVPYFVDPNTCGFNKNESPYCQYLTKDGKMCVAGKNMINPSEHIESIERILEIHTQDEIFKPEVAWKLNTNQWEHLQLIHDGIALRKSEKMENLQSIIESNQKVSNIEKNLFDVVMHPLMVADPIFKVSEWYGVFKANGGGQLGIVGNRFEPTQPRAVFMAFCDAILDFGLDISNLKYTEVKNGEIVRFSIDLNPIAFVNKFGKDDVTIPTLNLQIGLNGKTPTSMFITTLRLICTNGAKKTFTEFTTSFKNVKGNQGKIVGMFNDVVKCMETVKDINEFYTRLNSIEVDQNTVNLYLKRVMDFDIEKYGDYSKQKQNVIDLVNNSINLEFSRSGATLFGLYNGLTHYANHEIKTNDNDSVFTGAGSRYIIKAEKIALELAK